MAYTGSPVNPPQLTFAQTDLAVHEEWGRFTLKNAKASALMHFLVANMGKEGALVASQPTLEAITGMSVSTIKRAVSALQAGQWIEVRQVGGKGGANAYIVNERVAWTQARDKKRYALFSASVLLSEDEQRDGVDATPKLRMRKFPLLRPGEIPLPTGKGAKPPVQTDIPSIEPQLPTLKDDA